MPEPWKDAVTAWLKKMGYRFELRRATSEMNGDVLSVRLLWGNTGCAPCYRAYPVVLRLRGENGAGTWRLDDDIRAWLPDEDHLSCAEIRTGLPAGEYTLEVGIDTCVAEIGMLNLAIEGRNEDGFYPLCRMTIA